MGTQADLSGLARGEAAVTDARAAVPLPRLPWKTRVVVPAAIVAAAGTLLLYSGRDALRPAMEVRVVPVVVKAGESGAGQTAVQAAGWIEADPYPYAVSALAPGVVTEVCVLEGDRVSAGQVVARLAAEEARLALAMAEASLGELRAAERATEAAYRAAQQNWDHPVELTRRAEAAAANLARRQAELARWPAELAAEEARAVELDAERDRVTRVYEQGQASEIEFIRASQQAEAQRAKLAATRAGRAVLEAEVAALEAELRAAREDFRLRIADARTLEEAQARLDLARAARQRGEAACADARLRLERMEVRAPVDGVVLARLVAPGSKVVLASDDPHSAQVVRLYDPSRLQVRVDVPLAAAAGVGAGQPAEISVAVLPERIFAGRVTRVLHEADIQRNTLQVKVAIAEPAAELKPEMLARVRFLGAPSAGEGAATERVFAPEALLRRNSTGGMEVWLLDPGREVVERRSVTVGTVRIGGWVEIVEGLRPGDRLIADDPARLRPGLRVRVVGEVVDSGV